MILVVDDLDNTTVDLFEALKQKCRPGMELVGYWFSPDNLDKRNNITIEGSFTVI